MSQKDMKRVLVSGGSRGIGRACVEYFCAQGDAVAFIYRQNDDAAAELTARTGARAIKADLSCADYAHRAAKEAIEALGGVDVLINNAGMAQIKMFTDVTNEEWRRMMETNLSSAFYLSRAIASDMISRQYGRIINVGSMWGKVGASCEVAYSASKAGLRGLTMALAKELGPSGITVNCVEPGVIETDMNAALDDETKAALCEETPLCRMGKPEEVAAAIGFLASDAAGFITGQMLGVDGGFAV
jgi:3-oxoacyl-[acyl-carrier protein] reductase